MRFIESASTSPALNLAFEEYFFKAPQLDDDIFMLWQSQPAVVVGRFQNTLAEVNTAYADVHGIPVVRRISGGGAVYHDQGNLCFCFIQLNVTPETLDRGQVIQPIRAALEGLGLPVEVSGRFDLSIDGKKFSGNSLALSQQRLLFHGTLLFDADLDALRESLRVSSEGITARGVKSIRSPVTNLRPYLPGLDAAGLARSVRERVLAAQPAERYQPAAEELASIQRLVEEKYTNWEWNYGTNPPASIRRRRVTELGPVEVEVELEKGRIQSTRVRAGFLTDEKVEMLSAGLMGVRFCHNDIRIVVEDICGEKAEAILGVLMG